MERYIKQAIVHKNPTVASSALLCGLYLYSGNVDSVRRWVSEINQSLSYEDEMVQYHGLLLLHAMKQSDRLAMAKVDTGHVSSLARVSAAAANAHQSSVALHAHSLRSASAARRPLGRAAAHRL